MRRRLVLAFLLCAGCNYEDVDRDGIVRIVCLGDSNTMASWQDFPNGTGDGWCEQLQQGLQQIFGPNARTLNRAAGGTRANDGPVLFVPTSGSFYLDAVLANLDPFGPFDTNGESIAPLEPGIDVVLLAWGTNDLRYGHSPVETATALRALYDRARATGRPAIVATIPHVAPACDPFNVLVDQTNALLAELVPPKSLADFTSGTPAADYLDPIHVGPDTMRVRAQRALGALLH